MIPKIVHLDPYFPTGELTVQPVMLWANGRPCYEGITKHASVGTEYFKTVKPVPGHSFVYVLALSAWETYGENRNGDSFPEHPYKEHENPPWISPQDVLPLHYKTFEQFGYVYLHHANKNPEKSLGKVIKAFWNPTMHRVELLIDINNEKAENIVERISAGEFPPVSMGTRVMYDVCFLPNMLVRTSLGHKPISGILNGESARTHKGDLRKVTRHFVRTVESYNTLQGWGTLKTDVTCNHPFYVLKKEQVTTVRKQTSTKNESIRKVRGTPDWAAVEDLRLGDFVGTPLDGSSATSNIGTSRARLLGFYVGDGCPHYYYYKGKKIPTQIVLSLNKEQTAIRKQIEEAALTYMSQDKIVEYPYKKTGSIQSGFGAGKKTKGTRLYLNDRDLTAWCIQQGGTKAHEKYLSEDVFSWSEEEKLSLLGGYIDSDGCYYEKRNYTVISTINPGLALDIQRLGLSVGIPISLNHSDKSSHGYEMFIPGAFSVRLSKYSVKVLPVATKTKPRLKGFVHQGYWWTPIRKLEQHEESVEVHNLSVEDDESYTVNGVAVHNCSICGNRAPTRAQYCDHLKFQMRDIIDGRKVCALNPSPKFFDISFVFRGADPTAFMLKKVAHDGAYDLSGASAGEYLEGMTQTKNAARKMAVIDKIVQGIPVDAKAYGMDPTEVSNLCQMRDTVSMIGKNMPELPDNLLRGLSEHTLPKIFSSMMASGGMMLSTPEVVKITIYKVFPKSRVDDSVVDRTVAMQNSILRLFEDYPQLLEKIRDTGILDMSTDHVEPKIMDLVSSFMEKRSGIPQYLKRQLIPESWRDVEPRTEKLTISDPGSGNVYGTTTGAATRAHDEIAKANLKKVLGGAALLGGAYKLIGTGLDYKGFGKLKPLAALGLGALGVSQWPSMGKHYMTDQGVPVPTMTELSKVSYDAGTSLALPLLGTLGTMALMSHDYQSRLRSGIPIGYEGLPLSRRLLDQIEYFSDEHPLATGLMGTVGLRQLGKTIPARLLGRKAQKAWAPVKETIYGAKDQMKRNLSDMVAAEKLSSYVSGAVDTPTSTVVLPDIDLEKVAMWIGDLILNG